MRMINENILGEVLPQDNTSENGIILPNSKKYIKAKVVKTYDSNVIKEGSIMFCILGSGTPIEDLGKNKVIFNRRDVLMFE